MRNALSFDVEEYFQVSNFENVVPRDEWDSYPSRVVDSTQRILDLLARRDLRATFFVLGWIAERHPDLVRTIRDGGHEIASHGMSHRLVYDLSPDEFRTEIERSRDLLSDLAGAPVEGYRAPSFSITPRSRWALPILAEAGYRYDSSIFPVSHPRYGWKGSDPYLHARDVGEGASLVEFPPTTAPWLRSRLPAAGGAYLRLLPLGLIRRGFRDSARRGNPAILYLHPWEFDPDQPRLPAGRLTRIRHYGNLHRTEVRLERLLDEFEFTTVREVLEDASITRAA